MIKTIKKKDRLSIAYRLGATFDYQQAIIDCRDKYRTIVKPRQAGMTTAFAIEALIDALIHDNYVVCIISPTQRQSGRMMRYVKKALRILEKGLKQTIPTERFTSEEILFHHGSEIHSLPNNPMGIQGIDCDSAIIDEAGLFATQEGEALMDAVVGSLSAKAGRLTISGKPKGKRGMLWQFWDTNGERYNEFTHFKITWEDRARHDKKYEGEVKKHKRILTKTQFDETYNAIFVDEGVLIYPHSLLEKAQELWRVNGFVELPFEGKPDPSTSKFIGVDFGRKQNRTEIHVLEKTKKKLLRTLSMKSLKNINFEDQKVCIDNMMARFNPIQMKIDERGMGLPLLDYFTRRYGSVVQPLKLTNQHTKERVILQLQNAFTDLRLAIPDDEELYEQLHSYQKEVTDSGLVRYFGKVSETDFLDDKVIALAAAVGAAEDKLFAFEVF